MLVPYKGEQVSIKRLSKLSGCPTRTLYRAYQLGIRDGEGMIKEALKHLVCYKGKYMTVMELSQTTNCNYKQLRRRLQAKIPPEEAVQIKSVTRGSCKENAKLTPSQVLIIFEALFYKRKTQTGLGKEYNVKPSTISDIWRHKRWGWLTAPLRYELEQRENSLSQPKR
ncbi:hypothetical protein F7U66_10885 [Vibrio parahaemolyticus]|nr:hypothetical protein [Vibrio parahaemolyticus]